MIVDEAPEVVSREEMRFSVGSGGQEAISDPEVTRSGLYSMGRGAIRIDVGKTAGDLRKTLEALDPKDQHLLIRGFTREGKIIVQLPDDSYSVFTFEGLADIDSEMKVESETSAGVQDPFNSYE